MTSVTIPPNHAGPHVAVGGIGTKAPNLPVTKPTASALSTPKVSTIMTIACDSGSRIGDRISAPAATRKAGALGPVKYVTTAANTTKVST